jgi:hypothetical protein
MMTQAPLQTPRVMHAVLLLILFAASPAVGFLLDKPVPAYRHQTRLSMSVDDDDADFRRLFAARAAAQREDRAPRKLSARRGKPDVGAAEAVREARI